MEGAAVRTAAKRICAVATLNNSGQTKLGVWRTAQLHARRLGGQGQGQGGGASQRDGGGGLRAADASARGNGIAMGRFGSASANANVGPALRRS